MSRIHADTGALAAGGSSAQDVGDRLREVAGALHAAGQEMSGAAGQAAGSAAGDPGVSAAAGDCGLQIGSSVAALGDVVSSGGAALSGAACAYETTDQTAISPGGGPR